MRTLHGHAPTLQVTRPNLLLQSTSVTATAVLVVNTLVIGYCDYLGTIVIRQWLSQGNKHCRHGRHGIRNRVGTLENSHNTVISGYIETL